LGFEEEIEACEQIGYAVRAGDSRLTCTLTEELCGAYVALADERRKQTTRRADAARFCLTHKPRKSWMKRQTQHASTQIGNAPALINRAEPVQQFIGGDERGRVWRFKPVEVCQIVDACGVQFERSGGEIDALNFGRFLRRSRGVILRGVE